MSAPRHVVISSGGARGLVALGAVSELSRAGFFRDATSFAGTSVGAVLAAGLVLGRAPRQMLAAAAARPLEADVAPARFGVDSGRGLERWIRRVLGVRGPSITLGALFAATQKTLTICVCNVTDRTAEYWSHATHPDVSLVKALRISCGVPLVFAAVRHGGKLYVDGAVADAVPIVGDPRHTLAVVFSRPAAPIDSFEGYVHALRESAGRESRPVRYSVSVDPGELNSLDFSISPDAMRAAYADGRRQASRWIKKNV